MKEHFPRHVSCRDTPCCYSLFQKEQQSKHLFYSAEEQLCISDLCTEAAVICYEIHKQRIEVLSEVLFQSSTLLLVAAITYLLYASYLNSFWHVLL